MQSHSFLVTERKSDGYKRYYIDGRRVSQDLYKDTNDVYSNRKYCFLARQTDTHWKWQHIGYL